MTDVRRASTHDHIFKLATEILAIKNREQVYKFVQDQMEHYPDKKFWQAVADRMNSIVFSAPLQKSKTDDNIDQLSKQAALCWAAKVEFKTEAEGDKTHKKITLPVNLEFFKDNGVRFDTRMIVSPESVSHLATVLKAAYKSFVSESRQIISVGDEAKQKQGTSGEHEYKGRAAAARATIVDEITRLRAETTATAAPKRKSDDSISLVQLRTDLLARIEKGLTDRIFAKVDYEAQKDNSLKKLKISAGDLNDEKSLAEFSKQVKFEIAEWKDFGLLKRLFQGKPDLQKALEAKEGHTYIKCLSDLDAMVMTKRAALLESALNLAELKQEATKKSPDYSSADNLLKSKAAEYRAEVRQVLEKEHKCAAIWPKRRPKEVKESEIEARFRACPYGERLAALQYMIDQAKDPRHGASAFERRATPPSA